MSDWLDIKRGEAPLVVAFPHTGTELPQDIRRKLVSSWIGCKDADWYVDRLYDFASELGATTIKTSISRTVIDVNRDPSGVSLYPGQATTELCPTTTFDGEPLYVSDAGPNATEIEGRRARWFAPYHHALQDELSRLRQRHARIVLCDAHSIRSRVPRLFEGALPHFNIGTNSGGSCDQKLTSMIERVCDTSGLSRVTNGRFKGGWTTRHYGRPRDGVHAIQMELACRGYMDEPVNMDASNWPPVYDASRAERMRGVLRTVLEACLRFAEKGSA